MAGNNARKIPVLFYRTRGGSEIVRDWLWIHQENPKDSRRRVDVGSQAKDGIRRLKEIAVTKSKKRKASRAAATLSSLDGFLKEEGKLETFQAAAIKEVLAWQIIEAMKAKNISGRDLPKK
jgi:hypothetical protein